jgi:lysophospholipase L1-like esterase
MFTGDNKRSAPAGCGTNGPGRANLRKVFEPNLYLVAVNAFSAVRSKALSCPMARISFSLLVALSLFAYGIGVGQYHWLPWQTLATAFRFVHPAHSDRPYQEARAELFTRSPSHIRPDVVMLGDSLIEIGIWSELLEGLSVINRGVSGDDSAGVLQRLSEVLERHPRVICLEIGINDLQQGIPVDRVLDNVRAIVTAAAQTGSWLILQSVPFVVAGYRPDINPAVNRLNTGLRELSNGAEIGFFDLNAIVSYGGALDARNSFDGLHLNARGYLLWSAALVPELQKALR